MKMKMTSGEKSFVAVVSVMLLALMALMGLPYRAKGINITNIVSNLTTGVLTTNVFVTAGSSPTNRPVSVVTLITSNLTTGVLSTNVVTNSVSDVAFYSYADGWIFGSSNGDIGFLGKAPVTQQVATAIGALSNYAGDSAAVTSSVLAVSNLVQSLKNYGLLK